MSYLASLRRVVEAMPDGQIAVDKQDFLALVSEAENGRTAERELKLLSALTAIAAGRTGAVA